MMISYYLIILLSYLLIFLGTRWASALALEENGNDHPVSTDF